MTFPAALTHPLKIAFIHFYTLRLPRGIETLVISLSNELAAMGHDVSIMTARTRGWRTSVPISNAVKLHQFPVFRYYEHKTIEPLYRRHLEQQGYDVAIIFFADFGERSLLRMRQEKLPAVVAYWCYGVDQAPHRFESFRAIGMADVTCLMLADSRFVAEGVSSYFGREVPVVPVGTDSEHYAPNEELRRKRRSDLGLRDDQFALLNVAALERAKGAHVVISALPEVLKRHPETVYLVLGDGAERQALEEQARSLGVKDKVRFLGTTDDLLPFYCAGDCFILLSVAEANSVAMHEAMSCGLPVIGSNSGGTPEVLDTDLGFLVDRSDRHDVASAIAQLAADPELRKRQGANARRFVSENLTWKKSAEILERHLTAAVEHRVAPV